MKRYLSIPSLALSLVCGAAFAQQTPASPQAPTPSASEGYGHPHHRPNPHRQAEMLSHRLNLTPDQTARIEPILAAREQQMESLHANAQLAPEDRHAQMRTIMQQTEQQMSTVLTPDQLTQLKEMRHNGRMHHGQPGDTPAPSN